ncbi:transcriptional regulator [Nocardioides sp. HDW12B]|uniref:sigma-E factor regulatory protein RseB domain-containing protein n=1 Tax=Nocardioides sp. HDW12B TaxID=2714939 RepID=UPI00140C9383|nr:sigma-E factor regulatory protein RseB domain-containing protein [Nocardioides sp. HDW12B]QIK65533.1 transcriptional regulator [Nocardioides sp. HDW12B]
MSSRSAARRWVVVALGVSLLVAAPFVARAWPVPASGMTAPELVAAIRASDTQAYTGVVRSRGGVELPTDDSLEGAAKLLGRDGTLRVWWTGADAWRVATLRTTGETDLLHRAGQNLRWVYESKNVTVYPDTPVRLPTSVDVLPPVLAERVLQGARPEEVERLPTERIAGRTAAGLRLTPDQAQSSVGRVDLWADVETGLPLRVELYGATGPAALSTSFTDVTLGEPDADALDFRPPEDSRVRYDEVVDAAAAADYYAERFAPERLAGLPLRRPDTFGSVGLYGRGPTVLLALPLRESDAYRLRDELATRPGAVCLTEGRTVAAGPLQLLVTDRMEEPWLLAGTVTRDAVARAARELRADAVVRVGPLDVDDLEAELQPGVEPRERQAPVPSGPSRPLDPGECR